MLKLLAFLWSGCWHKWTILRRVSVFESNDRECKIPFAYDYDLQCERCGTVRSKRT